MAQVLRTQLSGGLGRSPFDKPSAASDNAQNAEFHPSSAGEEESYDEEEDRKRQEALLEEGRKNFESMPEEWREVAREPCERLRDSLWKEGRLAGKAKVAVDSFNTALREMCDKKDIDPRLRDMWCLNPDDVMTGVQRIRDFMQNYKEANEEERKKLVVQMKNGLDVALDYYELRGLDLRLLIPGEIAFTLWNIFETHGVRDSEKPNCFDKIKKPLPEQQSIIEESGKELDRYIRALVEDNKEVANQCWHSIDEKNRKLVDVNRQHQMALRYLVPSDLMLGLHSSVKGSVRSEREQSKAQYLQSQQAQHLLEQFPNQIQGDHSLMRLSESMPPKMKMQYMQNFFGVDPSSLNLELVPANSLATSRPLASEMRGSPTGALTWPKAKEYPKIGADMTTVHGKIVFSRRKGRSWRLILKTGTAEIEHYTFRDGCDFDGNLDGKLTNTANPYFKNKLEASIEQVTHAVEVPKTTTSDRKPDTYYLAKHINPDSKKLEDIWLTFSELKSIVGTKKAENYYKDLIRVYKEGEKILEKCRVDGVYPDEAESYSTLRQLSAADAENFPWLFRDESHRKSTRAPRTASPNQRSSTSSTQLDRMDDVEYHDRVTDHEER